MIIIKLKLEYDLNDNNDRNPSFVGREQNSKHVSYF